ncbi:MAG: hypothetical protein ACYDCQ_16290 [Dehalococcoidia bacterium]
MSESPKVNGQLKALIEALLCDQPIAYHPLLARAVGSTTAAVLLSQFLYWTPRAGDPEGWFYKTRDAISDETALTRSEQETARARLLKLGIIAEQRRGVPGRMHFRVDMEGLAKRISTVQMAETLPSSWRNFRHVDGDNPANYTAATPPRNSEITAETTPEITSREVKPSNTRSAFSRDGDQDGMPEAGSDPMGAIRESMATRGIPGFGVLPTSKPTPVRSAAPRPASGPPPEYIAAVIADMVREFADEEVIPVNVSQAMALWEQSGVSVQGFVDLVYEIQSVVRHKRSVQRKLPYAFTCLRRSLPSAPGTAQVDRPATPGGKAAAISQEGGDHSGHHPDRGVSDHQRPSGKVDGVGVGAITGPPADPAF